ncbi:MAG: ABC transporter substrate-binding protein [Desulfobacca sp.]|uniref:ABC transporter substrate-binding protein n=1 Tax=Desulfobacca sp. TaxID=2067990 RepID=UPI00404949A7
MRCPGRLLLCLLVAATIALWGSVAAAQGRAPAGAPLFQEAEQLYRAHRFAEALARYEQFLQTSPPESQGQYAWLRTAELYGIQGNWLEARRRYEALLTMKTDSGLALQARYGVGQAHYKLGNLPEAERVLENLSASTLPAALRFKTNALLTEISLQTGNVTQAFSRLLLVAKDLPSGEEEWFQDLKTRLLERASLAELASLADLYRDTPLSAGVLLQLAKLELQAGRPEQAAKWLQALQQRFPDSPEATQGKQLGLGTEKPPAPPTPGAVGCLLPLSGEDAEAGSQVKNGIELAAAQTGIPLIVQDCGGNAENVAAAVAELADNPAVTALLGFLPSALAETAAAEAQRLGLPLLALTQKKDVTLGRSLVFRDFLTHRLMLQALVRYATTTKGWQRFAILYPNSRYGQTLARQFGDEINRQAARLVGQASYQEGGGDLAQAVQTLTQIPANLTGGPVLDAIFIPDAAPMVAAAAQELGLTNLKGVPLLGTNLVHTPAALQQGDILAGLLFADGFLATAPDPLVKAFVADFRQRYQHPPGYLAAQGYSSMRLLAETIRQNPALSRQELAPQLQLQQPPPGFSLFQGFTYEREAKVATKTITIRQGQFVAEP